MISSFIISSNHYKMSTHQQSVQFFRFHSPVSSTIQETNSLETLADRSLLGAYVCEPRCTRTHPFLLCIKTQTNREAVLLRRFVNSDFTLLCH